MRVALLFTDGVGVGVKDPAVNPLARGAFLLSQFKDGTGTPLPAEGSLSLLEPTFGVPGRPQSASNQSALLTGEPAPQLLGKHLLGFPNAFLRDLITERSIVRRIVHAGLRAELTNGYPAGFLDALALPRRESEHPDVTIPERAKKKLRPSAVSWAFASGGVKLRTLDDVRRGDALTHDVIGARARQRGFEVPARDAAGAAEVFWGIAEGSAFTFFEHHLADEAGHAQDFAAAEAALTTFDAFARAVIDRRPEDALVVLCSDHGNVEDLSIRNHTLNAIPVVRVGPKPGRETPLLDLASLGRAVLAWAGVETL